MEKGTAQWQDAEVACLSPGILSQAPKQKSREGKGRKRKKLLQRTGSNRVVARHTAAHSSSSVGHTDGD